MQCYTLHFTSTSTTGFVLVNTIKKKKKTFSYKYIHLFTYKKLLCASTSSQQIYRHLSLFIPFILSIYELRFPWILAKRFQVRLQKPSTLMVNGRDLRMQGRQSNPSSLLYGRLVMSRLGGGPPCLPLLSLALSSNIITLQKRRGNFFRKEESNSISTIRSKIFQNKDVDIYYMQTLNSEFK